MERMGTEDKRQALHRLVEGSGRDVIDRLFHLADGGEKPAGGESSCNVCDTGGQRPSHEPVGLGNIEDVMAYQPWGPLETDRGTQVREALTNAAKVILRCVPEGRYRDKAVDGILQVRMDANAGISFRGRF